MKKLLQNTLEEATTGLSFIKAINENAGEIIVSLEREVEIEPGEPLTTVEGITPNMMKTILNNGAKPEAVTFKTPGETEDGIDGVCQAYNRTLTKDVDAESLEVYSLLDEDDSEDTDTEDEETDLEGTSAEDEETELEENKM